MSRAAFLGFLAATAAWAQSIEIYPEFRRIDPFGSVVVQDRAIISREVLSPAVARNGYAAFHLAISVPAKESYLLYVATNPLEACRVSLYREHFVKTAQGWIPDTLTEVSRLPDFGTMPDPDDGIEGQNTRLYLLELWVPPNAEISRFRLEVQLKVAEWTVRPMEIRVMEARVPEVKPGENSPVLPGIEQAADAAALDAVREYLSGVPPRFDPHPMTVRGMIRRNAIQDLALAAMLPRETGGKEAIDRRVLGLFSANYWFPPRLFGAEWFLRLRDFLYAQPLPQ